MKDLRVSLSKSNMDHCLSCPMAKLSKLPYWLGDSHKSTIFELIDMDVWGPFRVLRWKV